jgi:formylglycine-generating enzyme required for sulfatase activity
MSAIKRAFCVVRGGTCIHTSKYCSSSSRNYFYKNVKGDTNGLRLVLEENNITWTKKVAIVKGGSWFSRTLVCKSSYTFSEIMYQTTCLVGLRLILEEVE